MSETIAPPTVWRRRGERRDREPASSSRALRRDGMVSCAVTGLLIGSCGVVGQVYQITATAGDDVLHHPVNVGAWSTGSAPSAPTTPTRSSPCGNPAGSSDPWNDPRRDIARKLTVQPELFLVAEPDATDGAVTTPTPPTDVVAAGMAGFDGHRGWVNYLAVRPDLQGSGLGRTLMAEFERLLTDLGCPKLNLQVRAGNEQVLGFYESLGYTDDRTVSLGKRLIPDA